jgi:hypothetical protein
MNYWAKIGLTLVAVWALAGGVIYWARHSQPTPESTAAYLRNANLAGKTGDARARILRKTADMFIGLSFEDRQRLQREGATRDFFRALTPAEQEAFLDATLPSGFKQMMDSFNKMEPAKRKQLVDRTLNDMKRRNEERQQRGDAPPPPTEEQERLGQRIVDQGLRSFYKDANADVKLDLAPLIEQMQKNVQGQ